MRKRICVPFLFSLCLLLWFFNGELIMEWVFFMIYRSIPKIFSISIPKNIVHTLGIPKKCCSYIGYIKECCAYYRYTKESSFYLRYTKERYSRLGYTTERCSYLRHTKERCFTIVIIENTVLIPDLLKNAVPKP